MFYSQKNIFQKGFALIFAIICTFQFPLCKAYQIDSSASRSDTYIGQFVFDTIPANLEEITNESNRVFTGLCTDIEEIKKDPKAKLPVVKYTFKITEAIKGVNRKKEISFKQWKPTTREAGYEVGQKYLLFLNADSELGLTSPVGFLQGRFTVEIDENTNEEVVLNNLGNIGLSRNLRTQKKISSTGDKELDEYISRSSESGEIIRYKEFIRTVKHFANKK